MAIFKCKMCGGDLAVSADINVVECEYCGTRQTLPTLDNEKKVNLFNRANRLRLNSEFDKAATIYESIIAEFPEEAEAYWGLCLCNYGIEYVDDPATARKVPTCHRASFEKLADDENFNLAMEYADITAQKIYRDEAREIDRIMEEILAISKSEKAYDVFICYKETDENGERTIDSVLAQDIYDALTAKGMNVFFARITLEDKLGRMYEPYIFAALNSAKVMLAIGTKYEYYHAVWVKNEWSRFLKLMAKDKSKLLIPCYKDMDAYDLPDEFKALQAQDMGKIGFMQDLVRGVQKIITPYEQNNFQQNSTSSVSMQSNPNTKQLMLQGDVMYTGEVFADIPHGYGRAEYDKFVYEGEWSKGKRHGKGKVIWNKGGEWIGEFCNGEFHSGKGFYYFSNGSVYDGDFVEGKRSGQGKMTWKEGGEFVGEFRNDICWNGSGVVYTVKDGVRLRYEGEHQNGARNGYGKMELTDSVYEGQWKDGLKHGQGKMTWKEGGEFIGEFKDNLCWNGSGVVYTVKDGVSLRYEGEYQNGQRNGYGKIELTDSVYEGQWKDGKKHGQGKSTWKEGGEFVGEFRNDTCWNGNGVVYTVKDNFRLRYEGEYQNGARNGYGKMIFTDCVYEGQWKDGKRHGQGSLRWNLNGDFFSGEFRDNQPWNGSGVYYFGSERYNGDINNGKKVVKFFGLKINV